MKQPRIATIIYLLAVVFLMTACSLLRIEQPATPTALLPQAASQVATISPTRTKQPTASATRYVTRPPTATSTLSLPVLEDTPIPYPVDAITAKNIGDVKLLATWVQPIEPPFSRWGALQCFAFSPDGKMLAICDSQGVVLREIITGKTIRYFESFEGTLYSIAFSLDGRFLAAGPDWGHVSVWETATGRLVASGPLTSDVVLAFSPQGDLAIGTQNGEFSLWNFGSGQTRELQGMGTGSGNTVALAFSVDGRYLWTAGNGDDGLKRWEVTASDLKVESVARNNANSLNNMALSPNGRKLAVGAFGVLWQPIEIYNAETKQAVIAFGKDRDERYDVDLLAFSLDGSLLVASDPTMAAIDLWDVYGKLLGSLSIPDIQLRGLIFSPDGCLLAALGENDMVYLWGIPGEVFPTSIPATPSPTPSVIVTPVVTRTPAPTSTPSAPTEIPYPASIAYVRGESGSAMIYVRHGDGSGEERSISHPGCDSSEPSWAPDGAAVVFQTNCDGSYDLWAKWYTVDGYQPLTSDLDTHETEPSWSPDGQRVAFVIYPKSARLDAIGDLAVINTSTFEVTRLGVRGRSPEWSPDAQQLAYISNESGLWQVYIYDLESQAVTPVTACTVNCMWPAWSPDGLRIAYNTTASATSNAPDGLWIIPVRGGEAQQVLPGAYQRSSWSATGLIAVNDNQGIYSVAEDGSDLHQLVANGHSPAWTGARLMVWPQSLIPKWPGVPLVGMGTPIPQAIEVIGPENVTQVTQLARWGRGRHTHIAWPPGENNLLTVAADTGLYRYDRQTSTLAYWPGTSFCFSAIAYSPDGRLLVGGCDKTILVLDAQTGQEVRRMSGHNDEIRALAFSPDGSFLLSGSVDQHLKLWDVASGQEIRTMSGHETSIVNVAYSPDGLTFASVDQDNNVKVWDAPSGNELRTLIGTSPALAYSQDGSVLAYSDSLADITLWEVATRRKITTVDVTDKVAALAFSPDGSLLASVHVQGEVNLWDATTGETVVKLGKQAQYMVALAFSSDSQILATLSRDNTVKLWDVPNRRYLQEFSSDSTALNDIAISPDGEMLASAHQSEGLVRLWDIVSGSTRYYLNNLFPYNAAFSQTGGIIAVSGHWNGTIPLFDTSTGRLLTTLGEASKNWPVLYVAVAPDGQMVASVHQENYVYLWNRSEPDASYYIEGDEEINLVAFSPDGRMLGIGTQHNVILWDIEEMQMLYSWSTGDRVTDLTFSPDGKFLAASTRIGFVRVWEASNGALAFSLVHDRVHVERVTFSPDGRLLAVGGAWATYFWDITQSPMPRYALYNNACCQAGMAFTPDGKLFISSETGGVIHFWGIGP